MEATPPQRAIRADTELRYLKGVGPARAARLAEQGLRTAEDLLYHFPMRYEDRRAFARLADLAESRGPRTVTTRVVTSRLIRTRRRGFTIFEAVVEDDSARIKVVWYNQPYLARLVVAGKRVVLYGRAGLDRAGRPLLENPEYEFVEEDDAEGIHAGRIVPVYRKVGELGSRALRRLVHGTLQTLDADSLGAVVPEGVARRHRLLERHAALERLHFPAEDAGLDALQEGRTEAHRSLAFEEVFLLQLALALRRHGLHAQRRGITYDIPDALRTRLAALLPFKLTAAQHRVLKEIGDDLRSSHAMHRLLQGDVGSGKTIVALLTLLVAVENGYQAALMAPTEILADQHARGIRALLEQGRVECPMAVLTGSLRAAARRSTLERIRSGAARLVIGTHALFEAGVTFGRLGLVVVDEQHRFGVLQRAALVEKGSRPDVLVMTATPIPRSLALTLYGDLDLSVIDELPPGRTPVQTVVRGEPERRRVYQALRGEIARGRQAYVVVPLVEETERSDLKAATRFAAELQADVLPDVRVGLLHGRMKGAEKDEVMQAFAREEVHVLVATTVIEVGIDVPNATVMIVEHAERFGLSQLHQLRGRVGRGSARSYCVLMVGDGAQGRDARERLAVMEETNDGFRIAERDLELRGPGAVFGTQQHGLSDLQFLGLILRGSDMLDAARHEAQLLVTQGEAERARARELLGSLRSGWKKRLELSRIG
jgi:ATP-dependent DNA helicase RecG